MQKGNAVLCAGSERIDIKEGWGGFNNSQVIHRTEALCSTVTPDIVFSPADIAAPGTLIYRKYILPVLARGEDHMIFTPDTDWQAQALELLKTIFGIQESE